MRFVQKEFEVFGNTRDCVVICQGDHLIELSPFQCEAVAKALRHVADSILSGYGEHTDPAIDHALQFDGDGKEGA